MRGVYLIKVRYDLVEETEALQSFLVDVGLGVKLFEVRDGGEHHTHRLVRLMIKILVTSERKTAAGCLVLIQSERRMVCGSNESEPQERKIYEANTQRRATTPAL